MTVPENLFVLVAGWPGSGKSTLAAALAPRLGLPLLAKDEIKEALMDALGRPETVAGSQQLGRAAVLALLRVAARCPGAVLDSTWFDYALPLARALPGRLAEVHCVLPRDVAMARYQARHRHPGHLDAERTDQELWAQSPPSPGLGPVIEVDTTAETDLDQLIARLDQVLAT
ncbi:MAG TPA: AAA family ATPase [Streptosporangiaceae bacterium]